MADAGTAGPEEEEGFHQSFLHAVTKLREAVQFRPFGKGRTDVAHIEIHVFRKWEKLNFSQLDLFAEKVTRVNGNVMSCILQYAGGDNDRIHVPDDWGGSK